MHVAVALGSVGLFGVISYSVAQRRRELAIRLALGARPANVRSIVVAEAVQMAGDGALTGLAGSLVATRFMSGLLFGVRAWDPSTYGAVPLVLVAVATAASWLPARRASRVDATSTLRGD